MRQILASNGTVFFAHPILRSSRLEVLKELYSHVESECFYKHTTSP